MIKKWFFVAGAGVGYVLGTRAGRQKYDQLVTKAREVISRPDVQEVTEAVKAEAGRLYDEGRQKVRAKVSGAASRDDVLMPATPSTGTHTGSSPTTATFANGVAPTPRASA